MTPKPFVAGALKFLLPARFLVAIAWLSLASPLAAQSTNVDVPQLIAFGQANATISSLSLGSVGSLFDGNCTTLAKSNQVNPLVVTLTFSSPKSFTGSRIWFLAGNNQWSIEAADSVADLDARSGTYQLAINRASDPESAWQGGNFTSTITCRAIRLSLRRLTGDNYVHLCEWQITLEDPPVVPKLPFTITGFQGNNGNFDLTWNSDPGQWYEVQASSDLAGWSASGYQKGQETSATFTAPAPPGDRAFYRVKQINPEDRPSVTKKILVINLSPILESQGNKTLWQHLGWGDPHVLMEKYLSDITAASGGYVNWQVVAWVDLDLWPIKNDGFQYTDASYLQSWGDKATYPFHSPDLVDYDKLLDMPLAALGNKTPHEMASSGEVDEVVYWGFPYAGFAESKMVGMTAYDCNSSGHLRDSRLYVVMGLSYQRESEFALESFIHRSEAILTHVYGDWNNRPYWTTGQMLTPVVKHLWDRFTLLGPQKMTGVAVAGVGSAHFPPNADDDYQYDKSTAVNSEADSWLSFPTLSGNATSTSVSSWRVAGQADQRSYFCWWMSRLPKAPGRYVDPVNAINNGKLNNWWCYLVDMNEYAESR